MFLLALSNFYLLLSTEGKLTTSGLVLLWVNWGKPCLRNSYWSLCPFLKSEQTWFFIFFFVLLFCGFFSISGLFSLLPACPPVSFLILVRQKFPIDTSTTAFKISLVALMTLHVVFQPSCQVAQLKMCVYIFFISFTLPCDTWNRKSNSKIVIADMLA